MRIIAVQNQKGGVGKTTTALALGAEAARAGGRVLLVDADAQGNLTTGLGLPLGGSAERDLAWLLGKVMQGARPDTKAAVLGWDGVADGRSRDAIHMDVLPGGPMLAEARQRLIPWMGPRENAILSVLDPVRGLYDTVVIDGAPVIDVLALACLVAADDLLVPSQAATFSVQGVGEVFGSLTMARRYNPGLRLLGVLPTMVQGSTVTQRGVLDALRGQGVPCTRTVIPYGVAAQDAAAACVPVTLGRTGHTPVGCAYRDLANEIGLRAQGARHAAEAAAGQGDAR